MFRFKCASCDEWHEGMPSFSAAVPDPYSALPEEQRAERSKLTSDLCIIDADKFFVRGMIEIPVEGSAESFTWGVWVSLCSRDFDEFLDLYEEENREDQGPYVGQLASQLPGYPETLGLSVTVHLRNNRIRPRVVLTQADHPLATEQKKGIGIARLGAIYSICMQ